MNKQFIVIKINNIEMLSERIYYIQMQISLIMRIKDFKNVLENKNGIYYVT